MTTPRQLLHLYFANYRGLPLPIWLGMLTVFTNAFGSMTTIFLSLYFVTKLGFSITQAGMIIMWFGIGAVVGSYLSGYLCDRVSPYAVLLVALNMNAVTLLVLPSLTNYHLLMVLVSVMGIANYAFAPAGRVWLMRQCNSQDRSRVNSLRYMFVNLGAGAAVALGGWLAKFGYNVLFIFNGLFVLFSAISLALFRADKMPNNTLHEEVPVTTTPAQQPAYFKILLLIYTNLFIAALMFSQLRVTYPIYLHDKFAIGPQLLGYLFLFNCLLIVGLQVPLQSALGRYNQIIVAGIGGLCIGLGMCSLIFGRDYWLAMCSSGLWTLGEMLSFPVLQVVIYNRVNESSKGKHMGIYQAVYALANILGPVWGSWVFKFYHGNVLWGLCGLLGILTFYISKKAYRLVKTSQPIEHK